MKSADPIRDLTPLIELAKSRGTSKLFGGLTRHYLHVVIKRYARVGGLHEDSIHCHVLRHSTAMRIWEKTQRPGAITGYLCHSDTASVYPYLRENDAKFAEDAMAAVLTEEFTFLERRTLCSEGERSGSLVQGIGIQSNGNSRKLPPWPAQKREGKLVADGV